MKYINKNTNVYDFIHNIHYNSLTNNYLLYIREQLERIDETFKKQKCEIIVNDEKFNKNDLINYSLYNSKFVPSELRENEINNIKYTKRLSFIMDNVEYKILFHSIEYIKKHTIESYIRFVYIIISILSLHTYKTCSKSINIVIILSSLKKMLPSKNNSKILTYHNVNSAVTTPCSDKGNILIFREEEWRKVLIHELFHTLGLDFALNMTNKHLNRMKRLFLIKSDFAIYETYCETMATLIHTCFMSYNLSINTEKQRKHKEEEYLYYIKVLLGYETIFSIFQTKKIFLFYDIDFIEFIRDCRENNLNSKNIVKFKETTNVFCYYILKSSLLWNLNLFFEWVDKYNKNIFQFDIFNNNANANINSFIVLLRNSLLEQSNNNIINDLIRNNVNNERIDNVYTSLRMTINDI
jgi:hypothetical protein